MISEGSCDTKEIDAEKSALPTKELSNIFKSSNIDLFNFLINICFSSIFLTT